jgi:hypothetical protein
MMRDLIKKILSEQVEKYDTLEMLRNYDGNNEKLKDLGIELRALGKLSQEKINKAITQFKKDFYNHTIKDDLSTKKMQKEIQDLGTKAYNNFIRTNKKFLVSNLSKVKIDKPNEGWLKKNTNDLIFFNDHIVHNDTVFSFPDRDEKVTVSDEIVHLLKLLSKQDFWGFIEGNDWSILNRINTHYTNWGKLIAKRDKNNDLEGKSTIEKVNSYFKERPIEEIHDLSELDDEQKNKVKSKVPTLSFADEDIILLLHQSESPDSNYDFNRMKARIQKTTSQGEKAEKDFVDWLLDTIGIPQTDVKVFSSYGNLVDITFQCDLMVKLKGVWTPIQVKNKSVENTKLFTYDIGGLLVYPAPSKYNCGKWVYKKSNTLPRSFDEDFFNLTCK